MSTVADPRRVRGQLPRLTRATVSTATAVSVVPEGPSAPVRIVHLGLGAFHRAHQAWYTARAADGAHWGIAAFTGRSPQAAQALRAQDGLYTLIERDDGGDRVSVVGSVVEANDGADLVRLVELMAAPTTAIVSLTVTEIGYRLGAGGAVDRTDRQLADDIAALREIVCGAVDLTSRTRMTTSPARLLLGLWARKEARSGPIAVVPCDNIPANGPMLRNVITALADEIDADLGRWIAEQVSFVSTSVDRITPRATDHDRALAAESTGLADEAPVVTEPYSDWVLSGEFPAGRPDWESAGAQFVADLEPFERRKLWLLNGAHSLLAYLGLASGLRTVSQAIADPGCLAAVRRLWDEAARGLPAWLDVSDYCDGLVRRFGNTRIEHRLDQIGMDGTAKLAVRIAPIVRVERARGRDAAACAEVLASWIALATRGQLPPDARSSDIVRALADDPVRGLIDLVSPELAADPKFCALVADRLATIPAPAVT